MSNLETFNQVDKFILKNLPKNYRRFYVRPSYQIAPYIAIIGGTEIKTHFILIKAPDEQMTEEEHEFSNWCLMHGSAAWCCVRSLSDVEAALNHWGLI